MAFIPYLPESAVAAEDRLPDTDNILRIHGVHARVGRLHYDLFLELMLRPGPLSWARREMIAVVVSATNGCRY
jgi:hypothetical protein